MAESILFNSAEKVLGTIATLAAQEIILACSLESDLRRLRRTLSSIQAVILHAEEQQMSDPRITNWLSQLKDVLYDAEDVLDDFAYQELRKKVVKTYGDFNCKVRHFFSSSNPIAYRLRLGHQINDLRLRLDEIAADKAQFNLTDRLDNGRVHLKEREMTDSFLNSSDLIGREGDVEAIVKFLMDPCEGHLNSDNVCVIPIVGIGGLGKTALAKMVFNDQRVVGHFDSKLWVCLGDLKEFNFNKALAKIAGEMGVPSSNPQMLQNHLQDKRFLLVLDDVWEANRDKWLQLKSMLSSRCAGSKIVVTTRIPLVASCVGTVDAYNLKGLPLEESVALFKKLSFTNEAKIDENLMKIGEDIVRKCKGVPLAVRSLGSMLFSKSNESEWLSLRDSSIWQAQEMGNDILPILKFSYNHLPSHLKKCFVYCCIFPEDYQFEDRSLILFWMAHGLLRSPDKSKEPEDVGKQFIKELLARGFFQDYQDVGFGLRVFKMHDMVRELACSLGQKEFATINVNQRNIYENVRHVCFEEELEFSANSSNVVRTVIRTSGGEMGVSESNKFSEACISMFKKLRVLGLAESQFEELPNSIGSLKHLRSLDVSRCKRLKRIPVSIGKLHNLQHLLFLGCEALEEVPNSMWELINLRELGITTKQKYLFPTNRVASLVSLHVVGCPNIETIFGGTTTTQLKLTSLRKLFVLNCKSLISLVPLETVRNKYLLMPGLEDLFIGDCGSFNNLDLMDAEDKEGKISHPPLPRLTNLTLIALHKVEDLPEWVRGCADTLQYMNIDMCRNVKALPEWLPDLTSLRTLKIYESPKLLSLPDGMQSLASLEHLEIKYCGVLSERCEEGRGEDWPKIAHVPNREIY